MPRARLSAGRGQAQRISRRAEIAAGAGACSECGKMNHLTEEELILHYYGEEGDTLAAEQHLEGCGECRGVYTSLQRVLNAVDSLPVPECAPDYGARVWQRVAPAIPRRRRFSLPVFAWRWAAAGTAFAGLLVAAFLAGRWY